MSGFKEVILGLDNDDRLVVDVGGRFRQLFSPLNFTWVQDTDPLDVPINANPEDGQTWLDTSRVSDDGYVTIWFWFDANGGWCNQPPPDRIEGTFGGTSINMLNNGGILIAGDLDTALPTTNPHVSGQLWNNSGVLNISSG